MILGLLAYEAQNVAMSDARKIEEIGSAIKQRWQFKAATTRAIAALIAPGDPLREPLFSGKTLHWRFDDTDLDLLVETESRKLDVNAADPALVQQMLSAVTSGRDRDAISALEGAANAIRPSVILAVPEALLPPTARFGSEADLIKSYFTTFTGEAAPARNPGDESDDAVYGTSGAVPDPALAQSLAILRQTGGGVSRPIYRIVVTLLRRDGQGASVAASRHSTYIMINPNEATRYAVIRND